VACISFYAITAIIENWSGENCDFNLLKLHKIGKKSGKLSTKSGEIGNFT